MPTARNRTRAATRHELDQVVIDQTKERMTGSAASTLARVNKLEKAAKRGMEKRKDFLGESPDYKDTLREAFDEGDEAAVTKVAASLDKYENSLLRPSRRKASR